MWEAHPDRGFRAEHDLLDEGVFDRLRRRLKRGNHKYVHFALPCASWSCVQRINGGTHTKARPEGDGSKLKEVSANLLAARLAFAGCYFLIENPDYSVWDFMFMSRSTNVNSKVGRRADRTPGDFRIRKRTRIRTNMVALADLAGKCQGGHEHFRCLGHASGKGSP